MWRISRYIENCERVKSCITKLKCSRYVLLDINCEKGVKLIPLFSGMESDKDFILWFHTDLNHWFNWSLKC